MRAAAVPLAAFVVLLSSVGAAAEDPCRRCVSAGAASVRLKIAPGASVAGYGSLARRRLVPNFFDEDRHAFWFKSHDGSLDTLHARVLVLESGNTRIAWVALDVVAVDRTFTAAVVDRLREAGVRPATVIISASHTHSGPGGLLDSGLLGTVAADRLDPEVRAGLLDSVVEAAQRAEAAKAPALVGAASVMVPGQTIGRLTAPVDAEAIVMKITTEHGAPVALLWNYAIHGTMLGPSNLRLSGDVMGLASRALEERLGVPALFVNGAVGDVSPSRHGVDEAQATAAAITRAVAGAWTAASARGGRMATRSARVMLPPPRLSLRNCLGRWVPRSLAMPLGRVLPREAELVAATVGNVAWVTVPGELQSTLGLEIKRAGRASWPHTFVAGLSNDYLGYFLSRDDYDRVAYVTCASLYGESAGERITRAATDLLSALGRGGRR